MKYTLRIAAVILATSLLTACFEPGIDGTSHQTLEQSIKEMTAKLPTQKEKGAFEQAMLGVMYGLSQNLAAKKLSNKEIDAALLRQLDGKTVDDILDMAKP